jgi:hypothetical protein
MREVEFRLEAEELGTGTHDVVNIYVDGVLLQEIVRAAEMPYAEAEGRPELAGRYAGLLAGPDILWPSRHFLGEPATALQWHPYLLRGALVMPLEGHPPYLLGCICGVAECQPVAARIQATETTITWSGWRTRTMDWGLSELGTFVFNRNSYEKALQLLSLA